MKKRLRSTHRLKEDLVSEINVTPFVDILLVLLIAFMVSAPLVTHSLNIELPEDQLTDPAPQPDNTPLVLSVDQELNIMIDGEEKYSFFKFYLLEERAHNADSETKKRPVFIEMDRRVPHEHLIHLMVLFKNAGFKQVGLVFSDEND